MGHRLAGNGLTHLGLPVVGVAHGAGEWAGVDEQVGGEGIDHRARHALQPADAVDQPLRQLR